MKLAPFFLLSAAFFGADVTWIGPMAHTSGWPLSNGYLRIYGDPISQQTILYGQASTGSGIYSKDLLFYKITTNTWTKIGGTSPSNDCDTGASSALQPWPHDRHPLSQMLVDTTRNVFVVAGGVCSNVVENTMWSLALNSDPTANTWTQISPAHFPNGATGMIYSAFWYDSDLDLYYEYGYEGNINTTTLWAYNPRTTANAAQIAAGAPLAQDWNWIVPAGCSTSVCTAGTNQPTANAWTSIVYDTVTKKAILFGGLDGFGGSYQNETWAYDAPTKTWTNRAPSSPPSAEGIGSPRFSAFAYNDSDRRAYLHSLGGGTPSEWRYDPSANTWASLTVGSNAGAAAITNGMAYDRLNNAMVTMSQGNGVDIYVGQLSTGIGTRREGATTTGGAMRIGQ